MRLCEPTRRLSLLTRAAYRPTAVTHVTRLAGADRIGTAIAISQAEFPNPVSPASAPANLVLARSDQYSDALAGSVLAKKLNVLLRCVACLVHSLCSLASSLGELLRLVLDLGVQAIKDGQDDRLQLLLGLIVLVRHSLQQLSEHAFTAMDVKWLTCVLDLMFSNMPAIPPRDWSKW